MKIIIIGGGLSGLTAGALLAKSGHQVSIFEKNKCLGGRARVLKENDFVFDMGPSWYMMPEVIENIFKKLGTTTANYFQLKELKTKYRIFSDSLKPVDVVSDLKKNYQVFEKISPNSSKKIQTLISKTSKAYEIAVNKFLTKPYLSIFDFMKVSLVLNGISLLSQYNPFQSYHSFIKKYISHPFLQKIFEFHTVFLGGEPYSTPALYSILISADFNEKIWYPMGGVGKLVEALEKMCKKNQVKLFTNTPVQKIMISEKNNKVKGINYLKNKKSIFAQADLVISTADYAFTELKLLPKKYQQYSESYWQKKDFAISSILIYLGINKKIKNLQHHNFYFQDNWDTHFQTIKQTDRLPQEPCFYLSATSKTDDGVAPKGHENLFILVPVGINTTSEGVSEYAEQILQHVENKIGEKFIDNIIYKKVYSQKDFETDYNAYRGNGLGLSHIIKQSVFMRPEMKSKKVNGLYYAGQFTQPGVGVPMVMLSAQYVTDLINSLQNRKV